MIQVEIAMILTPMQTMTENLEHLEKGPWCLHCVSFKKCLVYSEDGYRQTFLDWMNMINNFFLSWEQYDLKFLNRKECASYITGFSITM